MLRLPLVVVASCILALCAGVVLAQPGENRVTLAFTDAAGAALPDGARAHVYDAYGEIASLPADGAEPWSVTVTIGELYDVWVDASNVDGLASALFRDVALAPAEGQKPADLSVPPSCAVEGRLFDANGAPLAEGSVVAVQSGTFSEDPSDLAAYARGASACYARAAVGEGGAFALRGLTPGTHSLDLLRAGEARPFATLDDVVVKPEEPTDLGDVTVSEAPWTHLFDGRGLGDWAESGLFGQKPVVVDHDRLVLPAGGDMTGITWQADAPKVGYEISLQAMRADGHDFFCGLTFPVKDSCCSLILGGWGGSLVGLSSIDGADASENETSTSINFKDRHWYRVRVRVTEERIQAWLDERPIIDVGIMNRMIGVRWEMERCKPLGVATWRTTGALRDIRMREL